MLFPAYNGRRVLRGKETAIKKRHNIGPRGTSSHKASTTRAEGAKNPQRAKVVAEGAGVVARAIVGAAAVRSSGGLSHTRQAARARPHQSPALPSSTAPRKAPPDAPPPPIRALAGREAPSLSPLRAIGERLLCAPELVKGNATNLAEN